MTIQTYTQLTSERRNTWRKLWISFNHCTQLSTRQTPYVERLIPSGRVRLQKPKDPQLVKKFHAFCGTQRFISVFTRAHRMSLSRIKRIQSIPPRSSFHSRHNYCYLRLGPATGLSFRFTHRALHAFSFSAMCATCPVYLILIDLITLIIYLMAYISKWSSWHNFKQPLVTYSAFFEQRL